MWFTRQEVKAKSRPKRLVKKQSKKARTERQGTARDQGEPAGQVWEARPVVAPRLIAPVFVAPSLDLHRPEFDGSGSEFVQEESIPLPLAACILFGPRLDVPCKSGRRWPYRKHRCLQLQTPHRAQGQLEEEACAPHVRSSSHDVVVVVGAAAPGFQKDAPRFPTFLMRAHGGAMSDSRSSWAGHRNRSAHSGRCASASSSKVGWGGGPAMGGRKAHLHCGCR